MTRGAPDWSNVRVDEPFHRLDDMAELAARLGSPDVHDRAGSIVFIETFEYGLGSWRTTSYGTGSEVIIDTEYCNSGGYSCKFVAGSDGAHGAKIVRRWPHPTLTNYSVELIWFPGDDTESFDIVLGRQDGTDEHQFYLRYDQPNTKFKVKDDGGDWVDVITDIDLTAGSNPPILLKMVVDLTEDEFIRLIVNQETHDLSGNPAYVLANPDYDSVRVDIKFFGTAGANGTAWVDDVILKQAEPGGSNE